MQPAACGRIKVRFAPDSLLEGDGFEPSVPQQIRSDLGTAGPSPITVDSLATRNWKFRIHFPPADSLSLSRSRFRRSRTRRSARVWAAGLAIGSAETLGFFDIAPIGGNISVGPNSSTAVRLMWCRDCHAGPNEVGPSLTYGRSLNPDWAQAKPSTIR